MNLIWTPAQLAMLAKVVDLNGFSAAARALGVPKAAVSRAVADLETRTRRARARAHHPAHRAHRRRPADLPACAARRRGSRCGARRDRAAAGPGGGPLRVAADPTYGRVLLAPLVPRFLEAFPDVPLEVALDAQQLAEGAWDVAIRTPTAAGRAALRTACSAHRRRCCAQRPPICSSAARRSGPTICAATTC